MFPADDIPSAIAEVDPAYHIGNSNHRRTLPL